jgi:hypothetical protein
MHPKGRLGNETLRIIVHCTYHTYVHKRLESQLHHLVGVFVKDPFKERHSASMNERNELSANNKNISKIKN